MRKDKVVITGGHATPALAVAEVLKKRGYEIFWLGTRYAHEGKDASTLEYKTVPKLGIRFFSVTSAKLHAGRPMQAFLGAWKLPMGVLQSLVLLFKLRPDVILSFGSYVGVPVAIAGWLLGIPVITHEQTTSPGMANNFIGKLAQKVAITFPESKMYFDSQKTVLTGNPIREGFFIPSPKRNKTPILFITGGSRGSHIINQNIFEILPTLTTDFSVVHQTGDLDFHLAPKGLKNYRPVAGLAPDEFEKTLKSADLVISRAGANTVLEIAALGIPAILIPISWSRENEQAKNAQALADTGLAVILPEARLSSHTLLEKIIYVKNYPSVFRQAAGIARDLVVEDAAENVASVVESVLI